MNTSTLSFLDVIRQVQCQTCGKVAEYTQCELIDRLDKDWPRCCGEVMLIVLYKLQDSPVNS